MHDKILNYMGESCIICIALDRQREDMEREIDSLRRLIRHAYRMVSKIRNYSFVTEGKFKTFQRTIPEEFWNKLNTAISKADTSIKGSLTQQKEEKT